MRNHSKGRLPDFVVIGTMKGGTTSLHYYLSQHPDIHMSQPKEPRFFVNAPEPIGNWSRGLQWYRELFASDKRICGETSPYYTQWPTHKEVPARMHATIPVAKLVYLVREPTKRVISHFLMARRGAWFDGSFAEFIEAIPYASDISRYATQLEQYLPYYSLRNILVIESESLLHDRVATLHRLFSFLGVRTDVDSDLFEEVRHRGDDLFYPSKTGSRLLQTRLMRWLRFYLPEKIFYRCKRIVLLPFTEPAPEVTISSETRAKLDAVFREEVQRLRKISGESLPSLGYLS